MYRSHIFIIWFYVYVPHVMMCYKLQGEQSDFDRILEKCIQCCRNFYHTVTKNDSINTVWQYQLRSLFMDSPTWCQSLELPAVSVRIYRLLESELPHVEDVRKEGVTLWYILICRLTLYILSTLNYPGEGL